jgi:hypothetical protein
MATAVVGTGSAILLAGVVRVVHIELVGVSVSGHGNTKVTVDPSVLGSAAGGGSVEQLLADSVFEDSSTLRRSAGHGAVLLTSSSIVISVELEASSGSGGSSGGTDRSTGSSLDPSELGRAAGGSVVKELHGHIGRGSTAGRVGGGRAVLLTGVGLVVDIPLAGRGASSQGLAEVTVHPAELASATRGSTVEHLNSGNVAQDSSTGRVANSVAVLGATGRRVAVISVELVSSSSGGGNSSSRDGFADGRIDPAELSSTASGSIGEESHGSGAISLGLALRVGSRDGAVLLAHHVLVIHIPLVVVPSTMSLAPASAKVAAEPAESASAASSGVGEESTGLEGGAHTRIVVQNTATRG